MMNRSSCVRQDERLDFWSERLWLMVLRLMESELAALGPTAPGPTAGLATLGPLELALVAGP
jgi:hypothetical protein